MLILKYINNHQTSLIYIPNNSASSTYTSSTYTSNHTQISPSKISKYIAIGKPILSICNDNSPIYRTLKETTHIVSKNQKEEIKRSILKLLTNSTPASLTYTSIYELKI